MLGQVWIVMTERLWISGFGICGITAKETECTEWEKRNRKRKKNINRNVDCHDTSKELGSFFG
jgi:hypothetical protein